MEVCPNCGEDNPDRARLCMMCGTALRTEPAPPQEARKTVTVLFCDLVGSTALGERLDSESLREVMDRYFAEMKRIVERHGGIVEKYIGDAVMAVFGLPRAHEDDALRAVRAAFEMGQSLAALNTELDRYWSVSLANRIGVTTGEVVVGDPSSGQRLATGDTVNVAARLEQAAAPETVLVGRPTYRLIRDAVKVQPIEPLTLKGKSERVPAYRVLDVKRVAEGVVRRVDAPLVGREAEFAALMVAFHQAVRDRSCHLVAVLGEAGVGKSRLVAEIIERLGEDATILRGRCLSYGEGITYWPVAEVVRDAADISEQDSLVTAREKVAALAGDEPEVTERVEALIGLSDGSYAIAESFWAVRRLLERLAQHRPLLVAIEDIHWAEPTLMDLLGHVVDLTRAAPILLVCTARKEAFEQGSDWLERLSNASRLVLNPLRTEDSQTLIQNLLGTAGLAADARDGITRTAQGNPLFVEQMLSVWLEDGTLIQHDGRWRLSGYVSKIAIPPTISALLSARLDRLEQEERAVLAGASVVGQVFSGRAVQELCPPSLAPRVPIRIAALTTKEFIRPDTATFAEDEGFVFRHVLIRDAAYEAMLKRTRAELHERFAKWLERVTSERSTEYEESLAYHFEQAYRYRRELHPIGPADRSIAQKAAALLASAGSRALHRYDMSAATSLLSRAGDLLQRADPLRLKVLVELGEALSEIGDLRRAQDVLDECLETAREARDQRSEATANLELLRLRRIVAPEAWTVKVHYEIKGLIDVFEELGDDDALVKCWDVVADAAYVNTQGGAAEAALRKSAFYTERTGDRQREAAALAKLSGSTLLGPTPVSEGISRCEQIFERVHGFPYAEAVVLGDLGALYAMEGRFELGRNSIERSIKIFGDLGAKLDEIGTVATRLAKVDMLEGKFCEVQGYMRDVCVALEHMEERWILPVAASTLAQALCADGNDAEVDHFLSLSKATAANDDMEGQICWRSIEAKLQAMSSNCIAVRTLVLDVTRLAEGTDFLDLHAETLMNCAEALGKCGDLEEATALAGKAASLFTEKGNIVSAAKARKLLEELNKESGAPS